ncbi:MAG: hypothetical protein AAFV93_16975, partial [Chloroflexota bacterium]
KISMSNNQRMLNCLRGGINIYYQLQPEPEWVVYFPNRGESELSLVDLNRPEHPREISETSVNTSMMSVGESHIYYATFVEREADMRHWIYDISRGTNQEIYPCQEAIRCLQITLSPDGQWLSYYKPELLNGQHRDDYSFVLYDISNDVETIIATDVRIQTYELSLTHLFSHWLTDSRLAFMYYKSSSGYIFKFYDLKDIAILEDVSLTFPANIQPFILYDDMETQYVIDQLVYRQSTNLQLYDMESQTYIQLPQIVHSDSDTNFIRTGYQIMDWLPDDDVILVLETWADLTSDSSDSGQLHIVQYNLQIMEADLIVEDVQGDIHGLDFNVDGSKILMSFSPVREYTQLISVYDVATGEEMVLPITGSYPQWVD